MKATHVLGTLFEASLPPVEIDCRSLKQVSTRMHRGVSEFTSCVIVVHRSERAVQEKDLAENKQHNNNHSEVSLEETLVFLNRLPFVFHWMMVCAPPRWIVRGGTPRCDFTTGVGYHRKGSVVQTRAYGW